MPITYKDQKQHDDVNLIVDRLLANARNLLIEQDVEAIYDYIWNDIPETADMNGDVLGKVTELLLTDVCPYLLEYTNELCKGMFFGCNLTEITIPANITKFGTWVFGSSDIETINYLGTRAQWEALAKNSDANWDVLSPYGDRTVQNAIVVNCSDDIDIYQEFRDLVEIEAENNILEEAMTKSEVVFKRNIIDYMASTGFLTFSKYLDLFHFNFLTSKEAGRAFVAAISPERGVILVNPNVNANAISMLLRHEAGHQIFKHNEHMLAKLKELGIDSPSQLAYELSNKVGDYDIANQLYDKDDYITAKHIDLGDDGKPFLPPEEKYFKGLVTELDFPEHPEYWTMDFDQLWDIFVKDYDRDTLAKKALGKEPEEELSPEYVEGWNRLMKDYQSGKITKAQIERWLNSH